MRLLSLLSFGHIYSLSSFVSKAIYRFLAVKLPVTQLSLHPVLDFGLSREGQLFALDMVGEVAVSVSPVGLEVVEGLELGVSAEAAVEGSV